MYLSVVVLQGNIPPDPHEHFLKTSLTTTILYTNPQNCNTDLTEKLLVSFVRNNDWPYGLWEVYTNVHILIDMVGHVGANPNPDNFTEFPFESYLCKVI